MLVPPLKRERTESSRGRLNIRVAITEFYCDRPGRFAGLFVAGSKSESLAKAGPSVDGLVRLWGTSNMRRAGLQKVRLKERRDIGAAVTIAQRPTSGQKRRFDRPSAASGLAQQPDMLFGGCGDDDLKALIAVRDAMRGRIPATVR